MVLGMKPLDARLLTAERSAGCAAGSGMSALACASSPIACPVMTASCEMARRKSSLFMAHSSPVYGCPADTVAHPGSAHAGPGECVS